MLLNENDVIREVFIAIGVKTWCIPKVGWEEIMPPNEERAKNKETTNFPEHQPLSHQIIVTYQARVPLVSHPSSPFATPTKFPVPGHTDHAPSLSPSTLALDATPLTRGH